MPTDVTVGHAAAQANLSAAPNRDMVRKTRPGTQADYSESANSNDKSNVLSSAGHAQVSDHAVRRYVIEAGRARLRVPRAVRTPIADETQCLVLALLRRAG